MLVGSGDLRGSFEEFLKGCNNVTFLPRIEQSMVKLFLAKCDILYLSTQDSEVWTYGQSMNKVVEYMLAAKPIIASYAGYPSMINEAECGIFVKSKEAEEIKRAILAVTSLSSEDREVMGKRGKEWIYANRQYGFLAKEYLDKIESIQK